ncbi:MAG: putative phosphoenolpyruvate synthase, partial [Parcubacteria group bacterium GW2011_GWA1_Parcubacteria_45_10]
MKYLISPSEYTLPNPRIDGFRKLKEVGASTVDIFILSLDSFSFFLENKKLPAELEEEIRATMPSIIENASTHSVAVRRAYVVPGTDNPPGPRFVGLTDANSVIDAIKQTYDFAITQKYNEVANSQIGIFFHASIGTPKYPEGNQDVSLVPYGGYAINENGFVEIYSVFGMNEGVQSLVADRYLTEERRGKYYIVKKEIPQKNKMICTAASGEVKLLEVPIEMQFDQVLSDGEIIETARVVGGLSKKYGPQRVEFSSEKSNVLFNEVADYWKEAKKDAPENINLKGAVRVISNIGDFQKLSEISKEDLLSGKVIVKVGENIITNRDYDVLGALAAWKDNLFVLYPGVAATQHAMRVLTDKGHKAFLIGNQKFDEGDQAQIVVTGGKVRVTNLSKTENQN